MRPLSERAKEIFLFILENCDSARMDAVVKEKCGNDNALKQRVLELLSAHDGNDSLLDQQPATMPLVISESAGDVIGCYKLLQQIGEGGFGVVFMAEQTEPVRRRVALKVIKPGMDTKEVVARFEAERQALAIMEHPNIAKVFSAGATDSGRPYFVMELVKGVQITEYADANNLSAEGRLRLFSKVCRAVHHAHQKGVIHRDLKPSNVLVTLHDGEPVPKIIDFGVSKAICQPLTEKTMFTRFGQAIGTPQYMSPEQAEMSGLDIDTRSDVYSLGVLLYELLTGQTPFTVEQIREVGFDEMRRIIREQEPLRPSNIVESFDADAATVVASHRSCKPEQLRKSIRGELDWIVLMALEKDRRRRYDTANSFAEDIENHLNHEPVNASPPTLAYQSWKFYQRYHSACKIAAALGGLLIVGMALTTKLWIEADWSRQQTEVAMEKLDEQRQLAEQAAESEADAKESAQETLALLIKLLSQTGVNPDTGRVFTVEESLSNLASDSQPGSDGKSVAARLPSAAGVDLHREIGKAYLGAGKTDLAIEHLRAAVDRSREAFGEMDIRTAECLRYLGEATGSTDDLRHAIEMLDDLEDRFASMSARTALGKLYLINSDLHSAEETLQRACRDFDKLNPQVELLDIPHLLLSRVYQVLDLESEEDTYFTQAMKIAVEHHGYDKFHWSKRAMQYYDEGRYWESEFASLISLNQGNQYVKYHLALAYFENGQRERAIDYMTQNYEYFASKGEAEKANLRARALASFYDQQGKDADSAFWSARGVEWAICMNSGDDNRAISQLLLLAESSPEAKQIVVKFADELINLPADGQTQEKNLADTLGFLQLCGYDVECDDEWIPVHNASHIKDLAKHGHFDAAFEFGKKSCSKLTNYDQEDLSWQQMRCSRLLYQCLDFKNAVEFQQKSVEASNQLGVELNTQLGWANFELAHILYFGGENEKASSLATETLNDMRRLHAGSSYVGHENLDVFCQWQLRVIADGKAGARAAVNEAEAMDADARLDIVIRWKNAAMGMAYEELGELHNAVNAYEKVIGLKYAWPGYPQYHFDDRLIELLDKTDQLDRGKKIFTDALATRRQDLPDRHPLIGLTRLRLADVLIRDGEGGEETLALLEQARETMSQHKITPQHVLDRIDRLAEQANALATVP